MIWTVQKLWRKVRERLIREKPLKILEVEELPDVLQEKTIYIAGENEYLWFAALVCPCGCKEVLHMSLLNDADPRWSLSKHSDGTVSLSPSVWRKIGCKSHFFLIHSRIQWCKNHERWWQ